MTNLDLIFDEETLFGLTSEQFNRLVLEGEIVTDHAPAKDYNIGNEEYPRLLLCFDSAASNYHFEFEPEEDIDIFTRRSCLTTLFPKTGKIILLTGHVHPLNDFLLAGDKEALIGMNIEKAKFKIEEHLFYDVLDETSVNQLLATGNFKGQLAVCDCGEPGCSGTYLWAKDYIGLISFYIVGAQLTKVCLFPFRLK
jgi:hypothetical protein